MTLPATFDGQATAPRSWRAPSQPLLTRIDLQGLVERGALTGMHMQSDGSLILDCPAGLPAELEGLVEETLPPPEDRLARLERELEGLTAELQERERLTDRLEAVEFGLAERLQTVIAEEVLNLFAEGQEGPSVVEKIETLLTSVREAPDVLAQLTDRLPDPARLEARLEEIANRAPAPPDLTPLRQMNTRFLQAMQQVMGRLDHAIGAMQPDQNLADRLAGVEQVLQGMQPVAPDFDALFDRLAATLAPMHSMMGQMSDRLAALENRPAPVLDLTEQRKSFANYSTALSTSLRRIEALDAKLDGVEALRQDLTALAHRPGPEALLDAVAQRNAESLTPVTEALAALTARIAALESRPMATLDLTEQRKSFAGYATALSTALRRIESLDAKFDGVEALREEISRLAQRDAGADLAARDQHTPDAIESALTALSDKIASPDLSALEAGLAQLGERLSALENRPAMDVTEQRKTFASFATALAATLRRIESATDRWQATPSPLPELQAKLDSIMAATSGARNDSLTGAILALADKVVDSKATPDLPGFEAFRAAQQDFFQDLRFLLAEIIATQMRQQALAG